MEMKLGARMIQASRQQVNGGASSLEIAAEPMTMHYVAVSQDGTLHEVGDRILPGKESVSVVDGRNHSERTEKMLQPIVENAGCDTLGLCGSFLLSCAAI